MNDYWRMYQQQLAMLLGDPPRPQPASLRRSALPFYKPIACPLPLPRFRAEPAVACLRLPGIARDRL